MLIAVIVLAVAVLLLGIGILFLLKINQAHAETVARLNTYSQGLVETVRDREEMIDKLSRVNREHSDVIERQEWELQAAHDWLERVVVLVPDDVAPLKKGETIKDIEKEEVVSTSTEKDNPE